MKHTVNIMIIGDSSVGKTSLLKRFQKSKVDCEHKSTVGIDFVVAKRVVDGVQLKVKIWDTAG